MFDVIIFFKLCTIQQRTVKPTYLCLLGARKLVEVNSVSDFSMNLCLWFFFIIPLWFFSMCGKHVSFNTKAYFALVWKDDFSSSERFIITGQRRHLSNRSSMLLMHCPGPLLTFKTVSFDPCVILFTRYVFKMGHVLPLGDFDCHLFVYLFYNYYVTVVRKPSQICSLSHLVSGSSSTSSAWSLEWNLKIALFLKPIMSIEQNHCKTINS